MNISSPAELLNVFAKLRLSKNNLRFTGDEYLKQINDYFTRILSVTNYEVTILERQIFCLVFRASRKFKPEVFTFDDHYPTLQPNLEAVIEGIINECNLELEPSQLFNFACYADANKGDEKLITLKQSKWTKKHKIILKYNKGDEVNYVFFYHEIPKNEIYEMRSNWDNISLTPDPISTGNIKPKLLNESKRPKFSPIFGMLGIKHKSMNEIFLNSIRHNQVVSGIFTHIKKKAERYKGWTPQQSKNAKTVKAQFTLEFENTIFSNFPRIKSRWGTLHDELKQSIYRCFLELKDNNYELFLHYGENDQPFIHGDEWGDNFLMSDDKEVMLIDLEDTLSFNLSTKKLTNSGRLSHLYRRIYLNTDDEDVYQRHYLNNDEIDHGSLIGHNLVLPIFDVSRSMGRLVTALIQIYTQQNVDYLKKYNDEKITEFFDNFVTMIFEKMQCSVISKNRGWFLLSIIDWSLYWEQRKPFTLLEMSKEKNKFRYRSEFTAALSRKINVKLKQYYFISDELENFRVKLHQSPIELIKHNDHFRGKIKNIGQEEFEQFSSKNYDEIADFWCEEVNQRGKHDPFLDAMKMIYCDTCSDSSLSHVRAKYPTERNFNAKLNKDIEELIRYNKEVFEYEILNPYEVIPKKANYQTLLLE